MKITSFDRAKVKVMRDVLQKALEKVASDFGVMRSVPIPSLEGWAFPFAFERVQLFSAADNRVFEINRQPA